MTNTWAEGLNPRFKPLDELGTKYLYTATIMELKGVEVPDLIESSFPIQVLQKRIEVMKLPISFTKPAQLAVLAFVHNPGAVVTLLIDCLNAYEGKTVTVEMLSNLYPMGFYDEDTFHRYIDNYLKERKVKWSEIY